MDAGREIQHITTDMTLQILFHNLTCLERYLAVVHPVTALHLKNRIEVRNTSVIGVWLLSYRMMWTIVVVGFQLLSVLILAVLSLAFIPFFCAPALCFIRIHPGPGEGDKAD